MAGAAYQSPLEPPSEPGVDLDGLRFEVAREADDPQLRRLLRDSAMPGWVRMTLEREPCYFHADSLQGDVHHTMVVREPATGRLLAMGSSAVSAGYLNGRPARVGYLSQMRVDRSCRGAPGRLLKSYRAWRSLQLDDADLYLTSIIDSNTRARRLLTSGLRGLPDYREFAKFSTLVLPCTRWNLGRSRRRYSLARGSDEQLGEIADFLQTRYADYQCAPCWTESTLRSPQRCRGLEPGDFLLAREQGTLAGCLALWDQSRFKQSVIRGYDPRLRRWRGTVNLLASVAGLPQLPPVGARLNHAYLSHIAVPEQHSGALLQLIRTAMQGALRRRIDWLVLGFAASSPLRLLVQRHFRYLEYRSTLYQVTWDGAGPARVLDGRMPHVEVAVL